MKWFKHFITITKHRHIVRRLCFKCGLYYQGLVHDLSKYSPQEFFVSAKYYTDGTHSPILEERKAKGFSEVWMHHKGVNKHHLDYWMDFDDNVKKIVPVKIKEKYLVEMFCDRLAATMVYKGKNFTKSSPYLYYERTKDNEVIEEVTRKKLSFLLKSYATVEDKIMFEYLREIIKKHEEIDWNHKF